MEAKLPPTQHIGKHIGKRARTEDTPEDAKYAHTGPKRVRHWKPHEDREVTPLNLQPAKPQPAVDDKEAEESILKSPRKVQDTPKVKNAPQVQDTPEVQNVPKVKDVSQSHDVQAKGVDKEHETRVRTRKRTRN